MTLNYFGLVPTASYFYKIQNLEEEIRKQNFHMDNGNFVILIY